MRTLFKYLITSVIGLLVVLAIILSKDVFGQTDAKAVMQILSDGFLVPGVLLAGVGLLIFASNGGAFDMLAYGFRLLFVGLQNLFRKDKIEKKYKDYYEYHESRSKSKISIAFMLIIGVVFILLAVIFLLCYNQL